MNDLIMIVEDDPYISHFLQMSFEQEGYRILMTSQGHEALSLFIVINQILLFWIWDFQIWMVWKLLKKLERYPQSLLSLFRHV